MGMDPVAIAFAKWVDAHKHHVEAQKRLATAETITGFMGAMPLQELVDEVKRLKAESDRLLALAERAMRESRP